MYKLKIDGTLYATFLSIRKKEARSCLGVVAVPPFPLSTSSSPPVDEDVGGNDRGTAAPLSPPNYEVSAIASD